MTRIEKLLKKFLKNPTSLRFNQIEKILLRFGFSLISIRGSHRKYRHLEFGHSEIVPVHEGDCPKIYKMRIAKIINQIINEK
jgi:predicted RNA binding protein YcfA (HicA-like mRNA interferase family)